MPSKADRHDTDHGIYGSPGDVSPWTFRFNPEDRAHVDIRPDGSGRMRIWTDPRLTGARVVVRRERKVESQALDLVATTRNFSLWEGVVGAFAGAEYSFAFLAPKERPVYLVPSGVTNAVERIDRFTAPEPDGFVTPPWVHGATIYQVFPDRFARAADPTPDLVPWQTPPHPREFKGGDLDGIASKLDHLEAIGVEVLYLNPIFTSPSNHRYDTVDYYEVDPMLGSNESFDRLIDQIHRRGMKIILDCSFNHVHPHFFAFQDLIARGEDSQYRNWFIVDEWPLQVRYRPDEATWVRDWVPHWRKTLGIPVRRSRTRGPAVQPTYDAWYGVPSMPRIDLSHPEARSYMLDVARYWISEREIDGWRMDVVRYVDPDFWDEFRLAVKSVNPDAYLVAEIMGDASKWLAGTRFDATMNYTFRDLAVGFLAVDSMSGTEALDGLALLWGQYSWHVTLANQNLLDSHDTARFITTAGGRQQRLELAILLQMTFPGAPGIYYGTEVGLSGGEDPASRASFPWDPPPEGHRVFATIQSLTALRNANPALRTGEWRPLGAGAGWIAYERTSGRSRLTTIINRSKRPTTIELPRVAKRTVWGHANLRGRSVTVGAGHGAIIRT